MFLFINKVKYLRNSWLLASIRTPLSDSSLCKGRPCRRAATACMQASSRSLVITDTSPAAGGAIWCEFPMHQSVRYSTSLFRNLISCLKARSSLRFIMASTS